VILNSPVMKSKMLIAALAVVALSACGEKRPAGKALGEEWSRVTRDKAVLGGDTSGTLSPDPCPIVVIDVDKQRATRATQR
jgi:hypothetical protein